MTELTDKEKIIKEIYENVASGYGSIKDTYQQAKKKDPSIKYIDVKNYLDKLKHRQVQFKYKGSNSFISPHPLFEFEIDLIDLTKKAQENEGFRYCMVAIDNFTKFAWASEIRTKQPDDLVNAFTNILDKMGTPKQIYSDYEGSMQSEEFIAFLNKRNIKHITTIAGAHGLQLVLSRPWGFCSAPVFLWKLCYATPRTCRKTCRRLLSPLPTTFSFSTVTVPPLACVLPHLTRPWSLPTLPRPRRRM